MTISPFGWVNGPGPTPLSAAELEQFGAHIGDYVDSKATSLSASTSVVYAHDYGKGDGSQDELAHLNAAIAAAQALGNAVVDLGRGVWKVSNTLTIPSNVGIVSRNYLGHQSAGASIQPWTTFPDVVGNFVVSTVANGRNSALVGISVFVNNPFLNVSCVNWDCSYGLIDHCIFSNTSLQALVLTGAGNIVSFNFCAGGQSRAGASTTVSGGGQTFPSSTTLTVANTSGLPGSGLVGVDGVTGLIAYGGTSGGNTLTSCTGGQGAATNGGNVTVYSFQSLGSYTGLGVHLTGSDNFLIGNEFGGGQIPGSSLLTQNGYHCAVYSQATGATRWVSNIMETADTGFYNVGQHQTISGNRIEWNNGHGVAMTAAANFNNFVGNGYNNNGLGQNDAYSHIFCGISSLASRNNFVGERFHRDAFNSQAGSYNAAVCIHDFANGTPNINYYSGLQILDGSWVSQPWAIGHWNPGRRSEVRAAAPNYATYNGAPSSGTFTIGETYRLNIIGNITQIEALITGSGTMGTIVGVTATASANSSTITLNAGGGTSVPLGGYIDVVGTSFNGGTISALGNQVIAKNGDVLTMSGTTTASVSAAATSLHGVGQTYTRAEVGTTNVAQTTPAIATGQSGTTTTGVSGATLGNAVYVSYSQDLKGVSLYGWVSSSNVVSWFWSNNTGSPQNLASGNVQILVKPSNV